MSKDISEIATTYDISELRKEFEINGVKSVIEDKEMIYLRLSALKIARDFSISIYSNQKDQPHDLSKCSDDFLSDLFKDLDIVHKIADYNLKYILGSN